MPSNLLRDIDVDRRYTVSNREALITICYWVLYAAAMVGISWALGAGKTADEIDLILGFPSWFFWGVVVCGAAFSVLPYFIVRYLFQDVPLDEEAEPDPSRESSELS